MRFDPTSSHRPRSPAVHRVPTLSVCRWLAVATSLTLMVLVGPRALRAGEGDGSAGPTSRPASAPAPTTPYPGLYAFVDVHVVPMDAWRVLERQTVIVRDGIIRTVGPVDSVAVPANAIVIPGEGRRYLLPGLGDMHAELPDAEGDQGAVDDLLFLYLANGVTTVREGTGGDGQLSLKARLRREQILGPTLYVSSPPMRYAPAFDADSINATVTGLARSGWDLVRVPEDLPLEGWDLLAREIQDYAVGFGGPVPDAVGLAHALATGVSTVDHLDGLAEAVAPLDSPDRIRKARAVAGKARASGVWLVPTLSWWEMRETRQPTDALLERPEMRYVPREMRGRWVREKRALPFVDSLTAARLSEVRMAATKGLNDMAGGLVLGTGSADLFNVPGFSVHREMELMREAGITPYEVLLSATRSVATYASGELGEAGNFGTVATGNRADLILVDGNPLEDLSVLRDRAGVMVKGRWLSRAEIENRLAEIAASQSSPAG